MLYCDESDFDDYCDSNLLDLKPLPTFNHQSHFALTVIQPGKGSISIIIPRSKRLIEHVFTVLP
jgi:hypothetical protein